MIDVDWFDRENGILLWTYPANWTIAMYENAFELSLKLAKRHIGRLDVIEDQRATNLIPRRYLYHVLDRHSKLNTEHITLGIVVILTDKPRMQFITQMANALPSVDRRFHLASTLEEASAFIQDTRQINHIS